MGSPRQGGLAIIIRFAIAAVCAAAGLMGAGPVSAGCALKTNEIPVTMQGLSPMVTAKVNGREGRFLLDSGAAINSINGKFAAALNLKPLGVAETGTRLNVDASTNIEGVAGVPTINGLVKAAHFDFVGASFKDVPFMATNRIGELDGLLGQAFLRGVDVDYDLGAGMVRLVKPEGCQNANLAYWVKPGDSYSMAPLEWADRDNPHTETTIYVNGVKLKAVIDSGAGYSLITETAAARAGVRVGDPQVKPFREGEGLDGKFKSWIGTFSTVKVGDEEIKGAVLEIGRSSTSWFDVLLGADFLLSHHVYVANSQGKIYFTYSGGPPFRAPRPEQAAAK